MHFAQLRTYRSKDELAAHRSRRSADGQHARLQNTPAVTCDSGWTLLRMVMSQSWSCSGWYSKHIAWSIFFCNLASLQQLARVMLRRGRSTGSGRRAAVTRLGHQALVGIGHGSDAQPRDQPKTYACTLLAEAACFSSARSSPPASEPSVDLQAARHADDRQLPQEGGAHVRGKSRSQYAARS